MSIKKLKFPDRFLKILLIIFGGIALFLFILACTPVPFHLWYRLSNSKARITRPPDCIIVLGGGGMPSETGLMRCWYAAQAATYFPDAKIIVALPGDTADSLSSVNGMRNELILRGICKDRIFFEATGTNTRAQALNIYKTLTYPSPFSPSPRGEGVGEWGCLLVTSPEHLYRAVLTFRKAGFRQVDGIPAFDETIESDITFNGKKLGGHRWIPDIGENLTLRYKYWTQLHYEELLLREYFAITYYWVKGWI